MSNKTCGTKYFIGIINNIIRINLRWSNLKECSLSINNVMGQFR